AATKFYRLAGAALLINSGGLINKHSPVYSSKKKQIKVFIRWSGERSGQNAALLRKWLPMIHQGIECYVSAQEIGKGERVARNLEKELESSYFGLVCLTPENVSAPWLHFEAGALSKVADSRVAPILFELQPGDVQGPLSQFHAAVPLDNEQEMLLLLRSISQTSGEKHPTAGR